MSSYFLLHISHLSAHRSRLFLFGLSMIIVTICIFYFANTVSADPSSYKDGEVIVKYKESALDLDSLKGKRAVASTQKETQTKKKDAIAEMNIVLLRSDTKSTEELINEIENDTTVEYVEPNYKRTPALIPNDINFRQQWSLNNTGQTGGTPDADIDAVEAWNVEVNTSDTIVAVIDTGVRYTHEDLIANMWNGSGGCVSDTGASIAGGCPHHGWDYQNNDNDPINISTAGNESHGTNIAGIIGARTNNGKGISGISFHNNLKIMALRFGLDSFTEIKAINFAKNNGAKIINASYGGPDMSQAEKDAIDAFPGVFVAAAGNESVNNDIVPFYPCNLPSANIICVGASDHNDRLANFSNYSTTSVDIVAPGTFIKFPTTTSDTAYAYGNGTSFATPIVVATAGLIRSHAPSNSPAAIIDHIKQTGDYKSSLASKIASSRRVNLHKALSTTVIGYDDVHRFWSDAYQGHFYTISEAEKNKVINTDPNWRYEGVAFKAYPQQKTGTTPVYRFWSDRFRHHFYTISEAEKSKVINTDPNWRYEGIVYYAYTTNATGRKPLYRFWSEENNGHFYTASETEKNKVINNYPDHIWRYEGIGYYIPE